MKLFMGVCLVMCISCSWGVTTKGVVIKLDAQPNKREAPLPGGGYHGPSYKYLPPGLSSGHSSYDFGSSGPSSSYHGHGFGHSSSHSHSFGSSHHRPSSFEAYLGGGHGGSSAGYKYPSPSAGFSEHSYSHGHHGLSSGIGLGSSHHKPHSSHSFVVPSHSLGAELGVGASLSGASSHGYHYSKGSGSSLGHHSFGSHGGFGGHQHSFGASGGHGGHADHGYNYETPHSFPSASVSSGYSYEKPSYEHASHIPATSYGVPSGTVLASYAPNKYQGSSYSAGSLDEAPSYAVGHKGLGHFGYTASKPIGLNTDFIDSNKLQSAHSHSYGGESSRAPFKPSTFLGSTQETTGPSSYNHYNEYEGAHIQQPAAQYLPPTSSAGAITPSGYNYQPPAEPSTLYGTPAGGHEEHAGPHEPESNYLPPQQNYLPPGDSYLPPTKPAEQYLPPQQPQESYLPPSTSYGVPH